jgi:CheY-like chemotaxis protein
MPKMNGIELIKRIRPLQPELGIILLSGFVEALGLDEKSTGADVVINKGAYEIPHLLRATTRLLNRPIARRPPASQKAIRVKAKAKSV